MLTTDQFKAFVAEVHDGRRPFPWQSALLDRIVAEGRWPQVIDVPTGLGKTLVLDIAVFVAALGITAGRRRIFYVVDRRLVVDEAYEHAQRLSQALQQPGERPVTAQVAQRLRMPGDDGPVLDVTRMRGGVTWERTWLDRPDRYAVVTGTVDQVGSRLLFRGYGVSERARSIDAALTGTDSLIIVDEAHLAGPFVTTATAALDMDDTPIAPRPQLMRMSATTDRNLPDAHRITAADEQHQIAGARLRAPKQLRLVEVKTTKANADRDVAAALAAIADRLAPDRVVGVVVNTVARARAVFDLLETTHDAVLLTGRSRQVDRDYLLHRHYPQMRVDRDRRQQQPLIVVATQTVEVGANIDFDALVTDSAPLPSLVQRLGRLNRVAACPHPPAPAFVVHDTTVGPDDPVYGPARQATWKWLCGRTPPVRYSNRFDPLDVAGAMDASPAALRRLADSLTDAQQATLRATEPYVPVLHQSILDSWTRTAPAPVPDQPVAPFLHGVRDTPPPVTVLWRADLGSPQNWAAAVDALPPSAEEGIEVSLPALRRWLWQRTFDPAGSDLDIAATDLATGPPAEAGPVIGQVLRYPGRGAGQLVSPWQIRPGDTIVVPSETGGCDDYGWHPTSRSPVIDVGDLAERRGRPVLRLGPTLDAAVAIRDPVFLPLVHRLLAEADRDAETGARLPDPAAYQRLLTEVDQQAPTSFGRVLQALRRRLLRVTITAAGDEDQPPSSRRHLGVLTVQSGRLADDDTALGSSAGARQRIGLDPHQRAVARQAHQFATNLTLPPMVTASVTLAGRWHDEGKRDPRFQAMLWNGNPVAAEIADEPLAKSGMDPTDQAAFSRARRQAGYPADMRHEALSAQIATQRLANLAGGHDPDLVIHLVASHHGWARPLLPPVYDPDPIKLDIPGVGIADTAQTIDWQQPVRFAALNSIYGRWGLALLESVVRLADIWCSARDDTHDAEVLQSIREQP